MDDNEWAPLKQYMHLNNQSYILDIQLIFISYRLHENEINNKIISYECGFISNMIIIKYFFIQFII